MAQIRLPVSLSDNIAELATAVQYDIPAIALVFNDNAYGNVKRAQQDNYGGRVIGTELKNPDWILMAESFGVRAARVPLVAEVRDLHSRHAGASLIFSG